MKLYMIRHGETDNNVQKLFSGWFQAQLTEAGRQQARAAGERLKGIPMDRIYASDLDRTMETAGLIFPEQEIVPMTDLREIHVGRLGGRPYAEADELAPHSCDFSPFGGENREQLVARIKRFLSEVEKAPCERVAAVTHGALICHVVDAITGGHIGTKYSTCSNCSVSVFEHNERGWRMVRWNDTGELP